MRLNNPFRKITSSIAVIGMLVALGFVFGSTANAHQRYSLSNTAFAVYSPIAQDQDRYQDRYYDRDDVARIARDNGFRDGFRVGREDRESFRRYDVDDNPWYRRADSGFRPEFGHYDLYRVMYRQSFLRGYNEGFREWR